MRGWGRRDAGLRWERPGQDVGEGKRVMNGHRGWRPGQNEREREHVVNEHRKGRSGHDEWEWEHVEKVEKREHVMIEVMMVMMWIVGESEGFFRERSHSSHIAFGISGRWHSYANGTIPPFLQPIRFIHYHQQPLLPRKIFQLLFQLWKGDLNGIPSKNQWKISTSQRTMVSACYVDAHWIFLLGVETRPWSMLRSSTSIRGRFLQIHIILLIGIHEWIMESQPCNPICIADVAHLMLAPSVCYSFYFPLRYGPDSWPHARWRRKIWRLCLSSVWRPCVVSSPDESQSPIRGAISACIADNGSLHHSSTPIISNNGRAHQRRSDRSLSRPVWASVKLSSWASLNTSSCQLSEIYSLGSPVPRFLWSKSDQCRSSHMYWN